MAQIIRPMTYGDLSGLFKLHKEMGYEYNLPNGNSFIAGFVSEDNDKIIGYGLMHNIVEASLVINQAYSSRSRIQAIEKLIQAGSNKAKTLDISQLYTFSDAPFTEILRRIEHFKQAKGDVSVLDVI
jgi:hypothetical protein